MKTSNREYLTVTHDNDRLYFFDALRGVAMLCVVYFHICVYLLGESTAINESFVRWRMPLFFFISGFFAFAPVYDAALTKRRIRNRLLKQFYPTATVWLLFIVCSWLLSEVSLCEHLLHGIYDSAKVGYWFTFSLLQVFLLYAIFAFGLSYLGISSGKQTAAYLIIIAVLTLLCLITVDENSLNPLSKKVWNVLSLGKTSALAVFFFAGALVRKHWPHVGPLMNHYWFACVALVLFAISSYLTPEGAKSNTIIYLISRVSGLMFIISIFVCIKRYVGQTSVAGRYLQRLGRNTLPVYLFHFFILLLVPYFIDDISGLLHRLSSNPAVEFISFTSISIVFTEITLAADSLLKKLPTVHKAVFAK